MKTLGCCQQGQGHRDLIHSSVVECRTCDQKGTRRFSSRQQQQEKFLLQGHLSVLTLVSLFVPPPLYAAVARRRSWSLCWKCKWQVTAKHTVWWINLYKKITHCVKLCHSFRARYDYLSAGFCIEAENSAIHCHCEVLRAYLEMRCPTMYNNNKSPWLNFLCT